MFSVPHFAVFFEHDGTVGVRTVPNELTSKVVAHPVYGNSEKGLRPKESIRREPVADQNLDHCWVPIAANLVKMLLSNFRFLGDAEA